jgi:hypothetical protein
VGWEASSVATLDNKVQGETKLKKKKKKKILLLTNLKLLNQTKGNSVNVYDSFKGHNSYW